MFTDILSKGTFPIHVYRHLIKRDISHPCLQTSYQKGHFQSMFIDILSKGTFPIHVYRHLIKRDISHPCLQTSCQKGHFPSNVYRHLIKRDISHACLQTSNQKGHFPSMFTDILSKGTFSFHVYRHLISPPSNKSSTYINIRFSRLVNVTIWLLMVLVDRTLCCSLYFFLIFFF